MSVGAIITVNYHSTDLIRRIERLVDGEPRLNLYVVDNSRNFTTPFARTKVVVPHGNIGFGRACNLAARGCSEPILLFVNPDVEIDLPALNALTSGMIEHPNTIWGPIVDDGQGWTSAIVGNSGTLVPLKRVGFPVIRNKAYKSVYISGSCLGIHRELFLRLGGFDEMIFMYAEDLDLCMRAAKQGASIVAREDIVVRHVSGRSSSKLWPKFLRLYRSIRGHYTFLSRHYPRATSLLSALYLASGKQHR